MFTWFYLVSKGWAPKLPSYALGVIFLGCWLALQWWGHWVLSTRDPAKAALHAPFPLWDVLCAVAVFGFSALVWAISTPEGKKIVNHAWWLLCLMFGEFSLTRYSSFGPNPKASLPHFLQFPYDTIWALVFGLIIYYWAVQSGYETEDMTAILATGSGLIQPDDDTTTATVPRRQSRADPGVVTG